MEPLDIYNYKKQGNVAIDMIAACILHERRYSMPIKSIVLNNQYMGILKEWIEKQYGQEVASQDIFYFDTVEIRAERIHTGKILNIEYYRKEEMAN